MLGNKSQQLSLFFHSFVTHFLGYKAIKNICQVIEIFLCGLATQFLRLIVIKNKFQCTRHLFNSSFVYLLGLILIREKTSITAVLFQWLGSTFCSTEETNQRWELLINSLFFTDTFFTDTILSKHCSGRFITQIISNKKKTLTNFSATFLSHFFHCLAYSKARIGKDAIP